MKSVRKGGLIPAARVGPPNDVAANPAGAPAAHVRPGTAGARGVGVGVAG